VGIALIPLHTCTESQLKHCNPFDMVGGTPKYHPVGALCRGRWVQGMHGGIIIFCPHACVALMCCKMDLDFVFI